MALPDIKVDDTITVTKASGDVAQFRVVHVDHKSFPMDSSLDWSAFNTDSIVVKRRPTADVAFATTYTNGAVDVQQTDGKIAYYDAVGAVQLVDAVLVIDTGSGQHMEVRMKAGPIPARPGDVSAADDVARVKARIERIQHNMSEMGPGLMRAGASLAKSAMDAIDAGGPGWPPNVAGTPLLHKSGRLLNSLAPQNSVHLIEGGVRVTAGTDYAAYLQNGTGVFAGHAPWSSPHRKTQGPGKPRRGMPPRKFLFIDEPKARVMRDILAAHIMGRPLSG